MRLLIITSKNFNWTCVLNIYHDSGNFERISDFTFYQQILHLRWKFDKIRKSPQIVKFIQSNAQQVHKNILYTNTRFIWNLLLKYVLCIIECDHTGKCWHFCIYLLNDVQYTYSHARSRKSRIYAHTDLIILHIRCTYAICVLVYFSVSYSNGNN